MRVPILLSMQLSFGDLMPDSVRFKYSKVIWRVIGKRFVINNTNALLIK
jgi:hypothetical protein